MLPRGSSSPYRRGRFDLGEWRERFTKRLTSRFGLRLHMTLVVLLVFAAAFVTTRALLAAHVHSMGLRYLAASVTGYAAFFGLVRVWLWYVTSDAAEELAPGGAPDEVALALDPDAQPRSTPVPPEPEPEPAPAPGPLSRRARRAAANASFDIPSFGSGGSSSSGSSGGGGGGGFDIDGDGIVAVLVIAIVVIVAAAIFGAAAYLVYQAPTLLGEAAFEAVLASVLARSTRKVTRDGWTGSVFAASWKPASILALIATLGGFAAQGLCPGPDTLRGVIKQCVTERPKR
jgi:hypothetical protein